VYPEEAHADGDNNDAGEHAEEQEEKDPLRRLHLKEEEKIRVEGGELRAVCPLLLLLLGGVEPGAGGRPHRRAQQRRVLLIHGVPVQLAQRLTESVWYDAELGRQQNFSEKKIPYVTVEPICANSDLEERACNIFVKRPIYCTSGHRWAKLLRSLTVNSLS